MKKKWLCWIRTSNNVVPLDAVGSMSPNPQLRNSAPLKDPMMYMNPKNSLNYTLESKYMGVLLDAGRHYFPMDWLYKLIPILSAMQYNMLHFRFTDDQAFAIQLESYPQLAWPAPSTDNNERRQVYSAQEVQTLVQFARDQHNITIIPELNIPGHAGAWAGIPDLVVPCPKFACNKGYGIPLNITSPKFHSVVSAVLKEVLEIFENPPFLHLGGDEVHMSQPCWNEAGVAAAVDYVNMEQAVLKKILQEELNYPLNKVVRWQMTGRELGHLVNKELAAYNHYYDNRIEGIRHFWYQAPGVTQEYSHDRPYFASANLYLDTNGDEHGWEIYAKTYRWHHLPKSYRSPEAIIVGTFELGTALWWHRNVIGRLLAATLGNVANKEVIRSSSDFYTQYFHDCHETLGFPVDFCRLYGGVPVTYHEYRKSWTEMQTKWKNDICQRVTEDVKLHLQSAAQDKGLIRDQSVVVASEAFWNSFDTTSSSSSIKREKENPPLVDKNTFRVGILIDAVSDLTWLLSPSSKSFMDMSLQVDINMIQLRLMDDYGKLSQNDLSKLQQTFMPMVSKLGIEVMPEASLSSTAGGWYESGWTVTCPQHTCTSGIHIPNNISCPEFLSVAWQTVQSLLPFKTSPYLHLGSDERQASHSCFREMAEQRQQSSNNYYDYFDLYEAKLQELFHLQQKDYHDTSSSRSITPQTIVRWENEEKVEYSNRFGSITQCQDCQNLHSKGNTKATTPWFAHLDLYQFQSLYEVYNASFVLSTSQQQQRPLGIVASLGRFGSSSGNNDDNDDRILRLIAFAMGTAAATTIYDMTTFEQVFLETCQKTIQHSKAEQLCHQHETLVEHNYNQHHAQQQARLEKHKELVCKDRTTWEYKKKWKDIIPTLANITGRKKNAAHSETKI